MVDAGVRRLLIQAWSSVFVSGMALATQGFTRRNGFILTLALGIGIGVAMEGQIFDYPGPYTFFNRVLSYDYGFWPTKMVCKTPTGSGELCTNYNGPCCDEWDDGPRMWRRMIILVLKTPYGIGFTFAFILNLVLPEDKEDEHDNAYQPALATTTTSTSAASAASSTA